MYDMSGFSYDITDVVHLLQLRVRHKNSSSMDVNCPFCGETKGKMNVNLQKNVFRCNRCDASGGMLELHGRLHGVSSAEANRQIREALGKGEYRTDYQVVHAELFFKTGECSSGRRNRGRCNREVQDIANGSDELYGEGVPIEHGTNPDERFSSGGVDHTHQYIVANALKILSNDKGNSAFNGELNSSILMEATDWPDKLGNETDAGTFAGHFYDPDTGKNWLGQKSPTARTRAESYFQAAVNAYRAGDVQLAMSNLGKGTHYVSDLNEPHHASNLTAVNSNHSAFEKYVDKNRKSYTIAGNSFGSSVYTTALNTSTGDLMYSAAKHAKGLAADAQKESSYDSAGRQSVQHAIQTVTQYMYKFGKEVGIY